MTLSHIIAAATVLALPAMASTATAQREVDWKAVEAAIGRPGVAQPGDVYRFNFPRGDMRVTAAGVSIKPAFALGGWVAMRATSDGVVAMGDLVLADDELNPVIAKLQAGGVEQTAIHHHLMRESPRVYYVHIHGHGNPVKIAETVKSALALTKVPPPAPPAAAAGPLGIDTTALAQALGYTGRVNGGVYQVSVPRAEVIREAGIVIPPSMGVATAINIQPTGGGRVLATGDFVLKQAEVNPVIRVLRSHGIEVTALHSHMIDESPRLFFMHFWGDGEALAVAGGLRAALDATNSQRAK